MAFPVCIRCRGCFVPGFAMSMGCSPPFAVPSPLFDRWGLPNIGTMPAPTVSCQWGGLFLVFLLLLEGIISGFSALAHLYGGSGRPYMYLLTLFWICSVALVARFLFLSIDSYSYCFTIFSFPLFSLRWVFYFSCT